jgi:hypothetical protein
LDARRRQALLSGLGHAQVFITCTDKEFVSRELIPLCPDLFSQTGAFSFYRVLEGSVIPDTIDDPGQI